MEEESKAQLLQNYLDGKLTDQERKDFEEVLANDTDLNNEVVELQELELGLHSLGYDQFKNTVSEWEKDFQQSTPKTTKIVQLRYYFAAAASLALLIMAGYFLSNNTLSPEQLYANNYTPYEDMVIGRGSNSSTEAIDILTNGMNAYNQQDYQTASEKLNEYLVLMPTDYGISLYLGIAQMETGKNSEAEASFTIAQKDIKFAQQAQWYQAMLYLKINDTTKALNVLNEISSNNSHYKKQKAIQLLDKLN